MEGLHALALHCACHTPLTPLQGSDPATLPICNSGQPKRTTRCAKVCFPPHVSYRTNLTHRPSLSLLLESHYTTQGHSRSPATCPYSRRSVLRSDGRSWPLLARSDITANFSRSAHDAGNGQRATTSQQAKSSWQAETTRRCGGVRGGQTRTGLASSSRARNGSSNVHMKASQQDGRSIESHKWPA